MEPLLEIAVHRHGPEYVEFVLIGELDAFHAPDLQALADEVLSGHERLVVLDLRLLNFLDSRGMAVLLALERRCRTAGAVLRTRRGPHRVERALRLAGLDALLLPAD